MIRASWWFPITIRPSCSSHRDLVLWWAARSVSALASTSACSSGRGAGALAHLAGSIGAVTPYSSTTLTGDERGQTEELTFILIPLCGDSLRETGRRKPTNCTRVQRLSVPRHDKGAE